MISKGRGETGRKAGHRGATANSATSDKKVPAQRSRWIGSTPETVMRGALLGVALLGALTAVLGIHDAFISDAWATRIGAGFLVVCGVVSGYGALYILLGRRGEAKRYFVWALPLATAAPAFLSVRQFLGDELDFRLAIWSLCLGTVAACMALCIRMGISPARPQTLSGAVLLGTAVALLPLALSLRTSAQPESLESALSVEVVGQRASGDDEVALVRVTTTLTNRSNRALTLLGSTYAVTGTKSSTRRAPNGSPFPWPEVNHSGWANPYETRGEGQLVETGISPYPAEDVFQPGQTDQTSYVVPVPTKTFNTVGVEVWYVTARTDRLALQWPSSGQVLEGHLSPDDGSGVISGEWPVRTGLWLDSLSQRSRFLRIEYTNGGRIEQPFVLPYQRGMTYNVYADSEDSRAEPYSQYNDRLGRAYGIQQVGTFTELALDSTIH